MPDRDDPVAGSAAPGRQSGIPAGAFVVGLYVAVALVYGRQLAVLAARWQETPGESHGWLIALVVPVLLWMRRAELPAQAGPASVGPVIGLGVVATVLAAAAAAAVDAAGSVAFPTALLLATWLLLGRDAARVVLAPVAYFLFATPAFGLLLPALHWMTVKASPVLLGLAGVRAVMEESYVTVPAGTFEIAGGCSGLHFLVAGLATASLLAFVDRLRRRAAIRLVLVAAACAIVTNWIRVSAIIVIGNATDMRSPLVRDHNAFGWWLFAASLVPVYLYARRLARREPPLPDAPAPAPRIRLAPGRLAASVALVAAGPLWAAALGGPATASAVALAAPPIAGLAGPFAADEDWRPVFPGATAERRIAYQAGAGRIDAYLAFYAGQGPGHKLVGFQSDLGGTGWRETAAAAVAAAGDNAPLAVEHRLHDSGGGLRLVWSWYEVRGARLTGTVGVKLRQALGAIGLPNRSGIVALSARCDTTCDGARRALAEGYHAGLSRLTAMPLPAPAGGP